MAFQKEKKDLRFDWNFPYINYIQTYPAHLLSEGSLGSRFQAKTKPGPREPRTAIEQQGTWIGVIESPLKKTYIDLYTLIARSKWRSWLNPLKLNIHVLWKMKGFYFNYLLLLDGISTREKRQKMKLVLFQRFGYFTKIGM